eukprot:14765511-Alexandrium_andersonii.AAC.1
MALRGKGVAKALHGVSTGHVPKAEAGGFQGIMADILLAKKEKRRNAALVLAFARYGLGTAEGVVMFALMAVRRRNFESDPSLAQTWRNCARVSREWPGPASGP